MRILIPVTLIIGVMTGAPAAEPTSQPLAPTRVTFEKHTVLGEAANELAKETGIPIQVAPNVLKAKFNESFKGFKNVPFWDGLQQAADASGARITLAEGGRKVNLVPRGNARDVAATSGAFRIAVRQVAGRMLLEEGVVYHEVHLLVHWEPRLRVYRIDSAPRIGTLADVPGSKLSVEQGGTQLLPLSATSDMRVKIMGLTRESGQIATMKGEFTVTAADRMLAFAFDSHHKLPVEDKQADVTAALRRVEKKDDTWEVELEIQYPPKMPVFESFQGEWWMRDNRLVLRSPEGKTFVMNDYEVPTPDFSRPVRVLYRFKEDRAKGLENPNAKGWTIIYETPSPLADVKIPFELKNIPLP